MTIIAKSMISQYENPKPEINPPQTVPEPSQSPPEIIPIPVKEEPYPVNPEIEQEPEKPEIEPPKRT